MSCKVCGSEVANPDTYWCAEHHEMWKASPECKRYVRSGPGSYMAVVDFTTRVRAELENGARTGSEAVTSTS